MSIIYMKYFKSNVSDINFKIEFSLDAHLMPYVVSMTVIAHCDARVVYSKQNY
jgi:hypothetical protein